jgi:hypothetical protein
MRAEGGEKKTNSNLKQRSAFSRRDPPEFCYQLPARKEGVGNAGCSMHPQPRVVW